MLKIYMVDRLMSHKSHVLRQRQYPSPHFKFVVVHNIIKEQASKQKRTNHDREEDLDLSLLLLLPVFPVDWRLPCLLLLLLVVLVEGPDTVESSSTGGKTLKSSSFLNFFNFSRISGRISALHLEYLRKAQNFSRP